MNFSWLMRQPADNAGKVPKRFSFPNREEPSRRNVTDAKYLSLYT